MARFYYGGQAVLEGVMMRGQRHMAVACRAPDGTITVHEEPLEAAIYRHPVMKLPFLRGLVGLWDALGLGTKALMFSAEVAAEEPQAPGAGGKGPASAEVAAATPQPVRKSHKAEGSFGGPAAWSSVAIALVFMVGLFFVLPVFVAGVFTNFSGLTSGLAYNLTEGVVRLALFLGYIWLIGKMPDIQRVFGYHGAEHKTINAYEAGVELTPENVQKFTLLNPRCGTTFLLIVVVLATILFVLMGKLPFLLTVTSRIVLVPLVAAAAYELIRLMANFYGNPVVRAIIAPGLALQKMTTRPPELPMIEVGIAALEAVLVADGVRAPQPAMNPAVQGEELSQASPGAAVA